MRVINRGVAVRDLDMPPALQRREEHEEIGRAIAPVLIIVSRRATGFRLDWRARFGDQLLRCLIQAYDGAVWIARAMIHLQNIFHIRHERRVCLGRNDELLVQVRFENVFFSVRPIVLSLTRSTIFSATTLSSSRRKVHRARPFGGSEQVRAISFAAPAPSKMRGLAQAGECLRSSTASKPSSTNCRRVRAMVARPVFSAEAIRLSLQASPAGEASTFNRMRAFVSFCAGCLPPWIKLSNCSRSS